MPPSDDLMFSEFLDVTNEQKRDKAAYEAISGKD